MANRRRWLESQGRNGAQQESGQNEWHDIEYQGAMAKAPPCSDRTPQTPLPQQSPSSAREEGCWVLMEDRRRRGIAFEKLAKEMLRYLDTTDDVKVGITELQERLEVSEKTVFLFGRWPSTAREWAKRVASYFVSGSDGESSSVLREDPENADAAAKLAIIQGRRKPVDLCGRQAQSACRVREDGQENAEIPTVTE